MPGIGGGKEVLTPKGQNKGVWGTGAEPMMELAVS